MAHKPTDKLATGRLRILQTTDLHMCLIPFDYVSNRSGGDYSLARLAPEITARKSGDVTTLLFDTGDIFQGNPLADYAMHHASDGDMHPMVAAMNGLGYDAITLGNHDFDYGLAPLGDVLNRITCPVVLSNVTASEPRQFHQSHVLERHLTCDDGEMRRIKIGVLGLLTTDTSFPTGDDATVHGIVETAQRLTPTLREAGADIIVALCHCGIAGTNDGNVAALLAANADVDVILAGHVHDVFPGEDISATEDINPKTGTLHGKPTTMAGAYGTHLGQIDLELAWTQAGWQIERHNVQVIATSQTPERPDAAAVAVAQAVGDMHQRTRAHIATPLGKTELRIHSYFAQITADASLRLLADAKMAYARQAIAGTPAAHLPVLASVAPFRAGGHAGPNHFIDIAPGSLTLRDVGALYPFENQLGIAIVTGASLRAQLEQSASLYHQLTPGVANQPLIRQDVPAYRVQTVFGVTYDVDLTQPAGTGRIRSLKCAGNPVKNTDQFALAVTAFAMTARRPGPKIVSADVLHLSDQPLQNLIADYIRSVGTVDLSQDSIWTFTPIPQTSAVFQSSPAAWSQTDMVPNRVITVGALRPDGFRDYTLSF